MPSGDCPAWLTGCSSDSCAGPDRSRWLGALDEINMGVAQAKLDPDLGMQVAEGRNQRRYETGTEGQRHVHAQQPGSLDALGSGLRLGLVNLRQDALAGFKIVAAGLGQAQA